MVFTFILFFRSSGLKDHSGGTISVAVMVIISKVLSWKLLDFSHVQSSFSTIARHIDNGIWKILYSWGFYGHGSTYMLTLCEGALEVISCTKILFFEEHRTWTFHIFLYISYIFIHFIYFSVSQTNLVLKFNLVLIEDFSPQFLYLLIFCVSWSLSSVSTLFLLEPVNFWWDLCLFYGLQPQNVLCSYFPWNMRTY